jgi:prepilin-type N-terminal cleavage/methylation domain-containing protein
MSQAQRGAVRVRAAFTLLELLAVIAIVAALAGIVLGVGRRARETGKTARAKAELAAISAALESYRLAYGEFPQTDDEARLLQSLIGKLGPTNTAITGRPLLEAARFTTTRSLDPFSDTSAVLIDPWGQAYLYAYKVPPSGWTNPCYVLYSLGPDGRDSAALLLGGFSDQVPQANADNIYANRN